MEIWGAYTKDFEKAGVDLIRGEQIPAGLYHLVVEITVRHADGDHLFMRRDLRKKEHPGLYEMSAGGSALRGEDALTAAKRELFEETGIRAQALTPLRVQRWERNATFYAGFLCEYAGDKSAVVLQAGETIGFKWLPPAQALAFTQTGDFVPTSRERLSEYLDALRANA